jgi:hypothetical protein
MIWKHNQVEWEEVDFTEVINDNLDPNYKEQFELIFNFG